MPLRCSAYATLFATADKIGVDSPASESISTEDYAVALLDEIEKPAHRRQRFIVAN